MERQLGGVERALFGALAFAGDQLRDVRQPGCGVEHGEVGDQFAGAQQVQAGQQDAIDVEQRLDARRLFAGEQLPLAHSEAEIVAHVLAGDTAAAELTQFGVERGGDDDQRRQQLLEHVAVGLRHQAHELADVVGDEVEVEALLVGHAFEGLGAAAQADHFAQRQHVHAAQVVVGVGRREAVEVRPADRREQQRARMPLGDGEQAGIGGDVHGSESCSASRRARRRKASARS